MYVSLRVIGSALRPHVCTKDGAKALITDKREIIIVSPVKKSEQQRASKFYPLTDTVLGHKDGGRESPWLLRLLSSSIL